MFLQVDPEINRCENESLLKQRKKKEFGKALTNFIIDKMTANILYVEAAEMAVPFYTALGFKLFNKENNAYILKKNLRK